MDLGLQWIRRRQHALTRAVLGLFCAAWLQAAVVPCVMASVPEGPAPQHEMAAHGIAGHAVHSGGDASPEHSSHGHAGGAGHDSSDDQVHCPYCPSGGHASTGGVCDPHDSCTYPHDPQVDGRAATGLFAALPVAHVLPSPARVLLVRIAGPEAPEVAPKVRLSVSYCRFIE